jgi:hypothetical protein
MAKMLYGDTPWAKRFAIRWVRTLVFPEPAPAIIKSGPSRLSTASLWAGFNPLNISKVILLVVIQKEITPSGPI